MHPEIAHVAAAFHLGAAILLLPSLAGLVFSTVLAIQLRRTPVSSLSAPTHNPDAVILILEGMTRVASTLGRLAGFAGKLLVVVVAAVSVLALILAAVLYATGNGLLARQDWARGTAAVVTAGVLLWSLGALLAARGPWRVLAVAPAAGTLYALAALWNGYAA